MIMIIIFSLLCAIGSNITAYDFHGTHFIASYKECDVEALENIEECLKQFDRAIRASKATILETSSYIFPGGNSFTATVILSESHASIHTYPEHEACFIDLFTCGTHTNYEPFHQVLIDYLKPQKVDYQVLVRN